jgi:hypothetical protein
MMTNAYTPIKGKCIWWREFAVDEDLWDTRLKDGERRVYCSCFVEGKGWYNQRKNVPGNCPDNRHCRYYIKYL